MKESNQQDPVAKTTPTDVEAAVGTTAPNKGNNSQIPENKQDKDKSKCNFGKLSIILSVIVVVGVAVGTYFVVVSKESSADDMNSFSTISHTNKSTNAVQSIDVSQISSDIAAALIKSDHEGNNGSVFNTDPICRDFKKSSVYVFDCYHQRTFNDLPDNSTVKCVYLDQVGSCIQGFLQEEYEVECDRLDRLFHLNLNAEILLERSNFDVKKECNDWYDIYKRKINGTGE